MKSKLMALATPGPLAGSQANIINALGIFIDSFDGALTLDADPIGALGKISHYQDGLNMLALPLETIKTYLRNQNVSFSSRESGYVLTR